MVIASLFFSFALAATEKSEKPVKIIFFGDSITEGWKDKKVFSKQTVNHGIRAQTTSHMRARFKKDVLDEKPAKAHFLMGTNDIAENSGPYSFSKTTENIAWMCAEAKAHGIRVILGSLLPAKTYYWRPSVKPAESIKKLNSWLKDYAGKEKLKYIDYFKPMSDDEGGMKKEFSGDGIHPNEKGYEVMRPLVLEALANRLLD